MTGIGRGGIALILVAVGLAACGGGSAPNDVAQGVGFQDRQAWLERQAMLRGEPPPRAATTVVPPNAPPSARVSDPGVPVSAPVVTVAAAPAAVPPPEPRDVAGLASAAIAAAEAETTAPVAAAPAAPAPVTLASAPIPQARIANPGMSDEQDFDAVAGRETIESDAERRAAMQAERLVVQPTAVPARPAELGANVVDFALSTSHPVGERRYQRRPISQDRHQRNCRAFRAPDLAQEWFLQNGGPGRDRQGLDPDGDGYACGWDPTVYRAAAAAARN